VEQASFPVAKLCFTMRVSGVVEVDLYTLATGPIHHELPIVDGPTTRGTLMFDVEMSQQSFLTILNTGAMSTPHQHVHVHL
jgi:hypothetical protein